jgi:hypothetical protein
MEVCYWALLFMPLVIVLYLYSLQIKGDSNKKNKNKKSSDCEERVILNVTQLYLVRAQCHFRHTNKQPETIEGHSSIMWVNF